MAAKSPLKDVTNSPFISYDALLVAIDRPGVELPAAVRDALESRPLILCASPFGPPAAAARAQVQSGKLKVAETDVTLVDKEKELALAASDRFALSERDAVVLLRSRRIDMGRRPDDVGSEEDAASEPFWDTFATYLLNERHQAVSLVTQMMLIGQSARLFVQVHAQDEAASSEDEEDMIPTMAGELCAKRVQRLDKAELAASCIQAFTALCTDPMPEPIRISARRAPFWAKQTVREQIDLLGLAFLCFHQQGADGKAAQAVLDAAGKTEWATRQANAAFFDQDAYRETSQVEQLLVLLSIAALNLDVTALPGSFAADEPPSEASALLAPSTLLSVHKSVLKLVSADAVRAAPLLLSWALVLHRIVQALEEADEPASYDAFRKEVPDSTYQQAVSHALDPRCNLFSTLQRLIASQLLSHRLAMGYLDVLRGLVAAVPQMLFIGHLSEQQYSGFLTTMAQLYSHPKAEPMRSRFWDGDDPITLAEQGLLLQVEHRFPAQALDTIRLLTAVAAPGLFEHFDKLACLTSVISPSSLFAPTSDSTSTSQAVQISASIAIPPRASGRTLSPPGANPQIVCWDMKPTGWSGWSLLSDLLREAAGLPATTSKALVPAGDDVFGAAAPAPLWQDVVERDAIVAASLDLFAAALQHENAELLADYLDIEVLFRVLSKRPDKVLGILAQLLSLRPGAIWVILRGSHFFPREATQLLQADKLKGTYAATRALVSFVHSLFIDARAAQGGELMAVKHAALKDALSWTRDDVWAAHRGWRYVERRERFDLGIDLVHLFSDITEDTSAMSTDFTTAMLTNALRLAPLLNAVATGAATIHALSVDNKVEEADLVRSYVADSLSLILSMLSARRRVLGSAPSPLERKLILPGEQDHIAGLMRFVAASFAEHSPAVARPAVRVLAALTALCSDWPSPVPSLLAHLDETAAASLVELLQDERQDREMRIALWHFICASVESQPGLAMLLVSGQPIRSDGTAKARPAAVKVAVDLLPSTTHDAEMRAAILRFLDAVWQRLLDYVTLLKDVREQSKLWDEVVSLVFAPMPSPTIQAADVADTCYGALARASACSILGNDLRYVSTSATSTIGSAASVKAFLAAAKSTTKFETAAVGVLHSACEPETLQSLRARLAELVPTFNLDALRRPLSNVPALDTASVYGESYLYPAEVVSEALGAIELGGNIEAQNIVHDIDDIHALMDSQMLALMAWRGLLEAAKPILRSHADLAAGLIATAEAVGKRIAQEGKSGELIAMIHTERAGTLLALIDGIPDGAKDIDGFLAVAQAVHDVFDIETLRPLDALRAASPAAYHRPLFGAAFLLAARFRRIAVPADKSGTLTHALNDILRTAIAALPIVLLQSSTAATYDQDLALVTAVFRSIVVLKESPLPVTWLAYALELDVFPSLLEVVATMRPGAQRILNLCISLANFPSAAERLALEGFLSVLGNNALTPTVNAGSLTPRDDRHPLWVLSLTLSVVLASAVGSRSARFMDEVIAFGRQVAPQIARTLSWTADQPLSIGLLDEMEASASFLRCIARHPSQDPTEAMTFLSLFPALMLGFADEVVQALQHLNTLVVSFEPSNPEERAWLEGEKSSASLRERAVGGPVTQMLLGVLCSHLDTLVTYTQAFRTLGKDTFTWPFDKVLQRMEPARVTSGEVPAVGTLLELAGVCFDTLNDIGGGTTTPATSSSTTAKPPLPMSPFEVGKTRSSAVHVLETALLLATTQCALVARRAHSAGVREEVADEMGDALRKGQAMVKDAGSKVDLLDLLSRFAATHLVVMK